MSREAHTAAWRWERRGCKVKAGDRLVATLGLAGLGEDDLNARGRLIAAAPALLEALQWLVEASEDPDSAHQGRALDNARAAIQSATGEG